MKRKHEQIRLANLEILIAEAGSAAKLARIAGANSSYLSQVRHQMQTLNGTPRGVGDDLAVKLERGMGKPVGWMDEHHNSICEALPPDYWAAGPGPDSHHLYPLISWVQAGEWAEIAGNFDTGDAEAYLPCPVICSKDTFVLRVRGASMEPKFHESDLIFVDPNVAAEHGKYVVLRLDEPNEATFKQLIVEGNQHYLKALNPDWPNRIIEANAAATICGVVVFKGEMI